MLRRIGFVVFAVLAIVIGLYPLMYLFVENSQGLLQTKPDDLLSNRLWSTAFYMHILWGGLALLTGWSQFSKSLRSRRMRLHRQLGMIYVIAVLFSGTSGVYLGFYATGGITAALGFISLGLIWLGSTGIAYNHITNRRIIEHQKWMIISFAACFAAVTLRLWLPLLTFAFGEFITAYQIVAWLCWVPNLLIALLILKKLKPSTV